MRRTKNRLKLTRRMLWVLATAAIAVPVLAVAAPPYFGAQEEPAITSARITGEANVANLMAYSDDFATFLRNPDSIKDWRHDKGWRVTANMSIVIKSGTNEKPDIEVCFPDKAPTHGVVKIYYSPGVFDWLLRGRTGTIEDGEMIVKAQVLPRDMAKTVVTNLIAAGALPAGAKRTHTLTDGGVIVDELEVSGVKVAIGKALAPHGYPAMVKFRKGSFDGWWWGDWSQHEPSLHGGRSASTQTAPGEEDRMPTTPGMQWTNTTYGAIEGLANCKPGANAGHHCFPSYPTGDFYGSVVTLADGFGNYCVNCHASAAKESTFADLANIDLSHPPLSSDEESLLDQLPEHDGKKVSDPLPLTVTVVDLREPNPKETGGSIRVAECDELGIHVDPAADDPKSDKYTALAPKDAPDPVFVARFPEFASVTWEEIWKKRFPAKTYDHIVAKGGDGNQNSQKFVTSDQCSGCHSASGTTGVMKDDKVLKSRANMEVPHASKPNVTVDVSPYGEWQTAMMGLAGRDPVFFSQVQSERAHYGEAVGDKIFDTCMYCHGAMGRRLWETEKGPNPPLMTRDIVNAYPHEDRDNAKYGSGAREGISCLVCHTMEANPGIAEDEQGIKFFKGTSTFASAGADTVYGPYRKTEGHVSLLEKPMQNALGITPKYGEHLASSQLCGACHAVRLPVLKGDGNSAVGVRRAEGQESGVVVATGDKPGKDVDGKPVVGPTREDGLGNGMRHYEQTTFFEWENSKYGKHGTEDETKTCQGCHMPKSYGGKPLKTKIANIQDDLADAVHGRLPESDIKMGERDSFSRHSLNGLNVFVLEMFQQFPLVLGTMQINYQNRSLVQGPFLSARERVLEVAQNETATVEITAVRTSTTGLEADVRITNKAGHFFPTGVALRRAFVELVVLDENGTELWGSGRTNSVGEIVADAAGTDVLASEYHDKPPQPHYAVITAENQAQIYEEVVKNTDGQYTYSFLGIWESVKDNRIRPDGFRTGGYMIDAGGTTYDGNRHLAAHGVGSDADYTSDRLAGVDNIQYQITLPEHLRGKAKTVRATLYYQAFSPRYLRDVFAAGVELGQAGKDNSDIKRLYFLLSRLNTGAARTSSGDVETSPIKDLKLRIATAKVDVP